MAKKTAQAVIPACQERKAYHASARFFPFSASATFSAREFLFLETQRIIINQFSSGGAFFIRAPQRSFHEEVFLSRYRIHAVTVFCGVGPCSVDRCL
jgi:hypothetical protein